MNLLKEKIKEGKCICGTHIQLADPAIAMIYGQLGYDYIWLDTEHSALGYQDVQNMLNASNLAGTPVIVRVPQDDLTFTKKVLEMGPDGIIFPMVHTAEEANRLIGYTLYPPYGNRGCGPMRAVKYGGIPLEDYVNKYSLEMCRFVQIECKTAVDELEEMVKNPYIDGFVFGPVDLSGSCNDFLRVFEGETMEQMKKAISICQKYAKLVGVSYGAYSSEVIRRWHEMGVGMISVGSDFGYLYEQAKNTLKNMRENHKGNFKTI